MRHLLLCAIALLACRRTIPQDLNTGADGTYAGAVPMQLVGAEAIARGVVSYPDGDRVDWWKLTLPTRGRLEVHLDWKSGPRSRLAVDVFDAWGHKLRPETYRRSPRDPSIHDLRPGDVFIRVFAKGRADAGHYTLITRFAAVVPPYDWTQFDFPTELNLPAVPAPKRLCADGTTFEPDLPSCPPVPCTGHEPPEWPCANARCPNPPDPAIPVCQKVMACPNPPDPRIYSCRVHFPPPPPPAPAQIARIVDVTADSNRTIVKIAMGSSAGLKKNWRAQLVRLAPVTDVPGGEIKILRIDKAVTIGTSTLTVDQIRASPHVRFEPP